MLHVTTEVGLPGITEREKRHFVEFQNVPSVTKYKPRGRRHIPHGKGDEFAFKAHPHHISPKYTDIGLDWKSSLRPIGSPPHTDEYPAEESWPDHWRPLRTYPGTSQRTGKEWMLYPEGPGYDSTLRATWDGVHKATETTENEVTHTMKFGKGRFDIEQRNGIGMAAPGDKSYQVVEYSPDFHKYGSTLPVVNFGGNSKRRADTFVPLVELPPIPRDTFASKEKMRRILTEIEDVFALSRWRPSTPLSIPPNNIHGQASNPNQNTQSSEALDTKNPSLNVSK